jgi:NEDD8-activating enzyme E1 regulatory subunit
MATTDKYDRQLRLWGSHGQRKLMDAHLLLLGGDAVGSETLKNLVLPGIGNFTICDDKMVKDCDLGTNFFVKPEDVDKPRAEVIKKNLCEMNDDVKGYSLVQSPSNFINEPELLSNYTMIIIANQSPTIILNLSKICWEKSIPLLIVKSIGFLGYIRIQLRNHDIIEGKPDKSNGYIPDIRISKPFLNLERFTSSITLDDLKPEEHNHVPYVVILVQILQTWKTDHDGNVPTRKDRKELITLIENLSNNYQPKSFDNESARDEWNKGMHGLYYEENFKEAIKNVHRLWSDKPIRSELLELIRNGGNGGNGNDSTDTTSSSAGMMNISNHPEQKVTHFTILLNALNKFLKMNADDLMPHSGELPDMFSSTKYYVALQKVYESKAEEDKNQLRSLSDELCKEAGISNVDDDTLDIFCKNVYDVHQMSFRSIAQEVGNRYGNATSNGKTDSNGNGNGSGNDNDNDNCANGMNKDAIQNQLYEPYDLAIEQTPILWYLVLQAADQFYIDHDRYPGQIFGNDIETNPVLQQDIDYISKTLKSMVCDLGIDETISNILPEDQNSSNMEKMFRNHAQEIVRYGGCEMHNISAIIGGIGAQEAVKIATHQYIPMNNSYIYNGIGCIGTSFEG